MAGTPGNSGGPRAGTPGRAYPNRTDMNANRLPITTFHGQPYGVAQAQEQAQRVVPMGRPAPSPLPPMTGPTARPAEPVTTGLPTGPGAGPEVLGMNAGTDNVDQQLRALYALYPNNDLLGLIEELDRGAGQW
jgi:hypothetical protein